MCKTSKVWRTVKPAKCECEMVSNPIAPCELFENGIPGAMLINGTEYAVSILGVLPEVGNVIIDGFRLTKYNGEAHDICLMHGRLECTCGDYEFRRAAQTDVELWDCKHIKAIKKLLYLPTRDQYQAATVPAGEVYNDGCPYCGAMACNCWDNP